MQARLPFRIQEQPDETTCGPTCLHAIYRYYGDDLELSRVIEETKALDRGGTLGVFLANHALQRGYKVTIYTYNLHVFDPTWFDKSIELPQKLASQQKVKANLKLREASKAYIEFLDRGGSLRFEDLTTRLIREHLKRDVPILTGLSATYLYRSVRETPAGQEDDVGGEPVGHFVVLCGYDRETRKVELADPYVPNPYSADHMYEVGIERLLCAVMLGIATYDANLVIVEPQG